MNYFNRIKYACAVAILIMFSVLISGCGLLSDADEKIYFSEIRQPVELEYQFLALANEIHSAKPCYLIHPDSLRRAAFHAVGSQVTNIRSQCFLVVAGASGDAQLCDQVRSVSTVFLSGVNMNATACRQRVGLGSGSYNLDVQKLVALAGYTEDEVDVDLVAAGRFSSVEVARRYRQESPGTYWGEVRRHLLHTNDFFERIGSLPGFGTAADRAIMNALTWNPRFQRPWGLPEQRTRSRPEIRVPAQGESE